MRRTREDSELTRQALLDAALKVFNRMGYADARLEDIAREAGVTRGAVYHHFGGKTQLYEALLDERFGVAMQGVQLILAQGGSPLSLIRRAMIYSLQYLEEDELYRGVQELVLFKTAYSPELEKSFNAKKLSTAQYIETLTRLFRQGMLAAEFKAGLDPQAAAIAALGLLNGVSMMWLISPESFSLKRKAPAIVDIFLNGCVG